MLKRLVFLSLFISASSALLGQTKEYDYVEEKPFLTKKEYAFGGVLHTNGLGICYRRGKSLTVNTKRLIEVEFVSMKHPKEYKSVSYLSERPKSYIYGKMNGLLVGHGGVRFERILFSKTERNTFEIRLHATGGLSLGFTKPIYYIYSDNGELITEKFNENNPREPEQTYGKAEFTKGLDEMKVYPGLYIKTGTMFEYNPMNDGITAIEAGVMLDVFGKKIPVMAIAKNKQVWFNLYVTLVIGRKS